MGTIPDDELRERLQSGQSKKRRSAAKAIRKASLSSFCGDLLVATNIEKSDKRTWETQCHLILALGECNCEASVPLIQSWLKEPGYAPMVYYCLAYSLYCLTRSGEGDVSLFLRLVADGDELVIEGVLAGVQALGTIPTDEEVTQIVEYVAPALDSEHGSSVGVEALIEVVIAAANWDSDDARQLLSRAANSSYSRLAAVAKRSLRGTWKPRRPML